MAKKHTSRPQVVKQAKSLIPLSFYKVKGFVAIYRTLDTIVDAIVEEIVDQMKQTLKTLGKSFTPNALDEWTPLLRDSVYQRLVHGGDWNTDRANVLTVASDMATIASILSASSIVVNKNQVHAAFRAAKHHATCPGGVGAGRWCNFDI
jgi:hypothetical protein